jgi:thiamine biosynthesis lipoprotein
MSVAFRLPEPPPAGRRFVTLGMTCSVLTVDPGVADVAEAYLRDELGRLDRACSRFRADSELAGVERAGGRAVEISPLLSELVAASLDAAAFTDGLVDPTVAAALDRLGYDRDFAEVAPDGPAPTAPPVPAPGWSRVELDRGARRLRLPPGVRLDLGASAKAFAADRAARLLADGLRSGVLVNLAGDLAVAGEPPRDGWPVGIAAAASLDPRRAEVVVAVRAGALASSGVEVRAWRRGGARLHHIIDPRTGESAAASWSLVSVTAASCLVANAAATASIILGDAASAWLARRGLAARLVDHAGRVELVGGWPVDRRGPNERAGGYSLSPRHSSTAVMKVV